MIPSPAFAFAIFLVALTTASVLLRIFARSANTTHVTPVVRYRSIDGLRGFLAVGVFSHHCVVTWYYLQNGRWELPPSRFYVHLGQSSVVLFFMVTAFLFWGQILDRRENMDWVGFCVSRFFRLAPLYWTLCILLIVIALMANGWQLAVPLNEFIHSVMHWLAFKFFQSPDINAFPNTNLIVAQVVWSLRYEWLFYLALPLLALLAGYRQSVFVSLSAAAVLLICLKLSGWKLDFSPIILTAFVGGMLSAYWVRMPKLEKIACSPGFGIAAVAALILVVYSQASAYSMIAYVGLTIFFVAVASGNSLRGLLHMAAARWLGEISYSLYLLHGFLLWLLFQKLGIHRVSPDHQELVFMWASLVACALLVACCSVTFISIEKPGILLGSKVRQWISHQRNLENVTV